MTIHVKPETERLVREEISSGHFQTVDDLIVQGIQAWREMRLREHSPQTSPEARRRAIDRIRELRRGVQLQREGVSLREYAHLGHRY
jgi:Arc/MetJ-type ribon-helix-helix transcriptional regulator